jgi:hypothetical protein
MFLVGFLAVATILMLTIAYSVWKRTSKGSIYAPLHTQHM